MFQPGAFFEVAYGQLDAGVGTVERVDLDGGPSRSVRNPKCRQCGTPGCAG